jgi:Xaa-Pro aminopeptidase
MSAIQFSEIQDRQQRLLQAMGTDLLILPAGMPQQEISRFLQDTNFFYLTGFPEQGALLVIDPNGDSEQVSLFVRENTEREQVWDGFTMGVEKASELCPADKVRKIDELEDFLTNLQIKGRRVY